MRVIEALFVARRQNGAAQPLDGIEGLPWRLLGLAGVSSSPWGSSILPSWMSHSSQSSFRTYFLSRLSHFCGKRSLQLLECRQQRPFRRPALLLLVERRCLPAKLLAIFQVVEAEAVEEILAADQRHVPQAGDALRIGLDRQARLRASPAFACRRDPWRDAS